MKVADAGHISLNSFVRLISEGASSRAIATKPCRAKKPLAVVVNR
jgi:hypothetical protein